MVTNSGIVSVIQIVAVAGVNVKQFKMQFNDVVINCQRVQNHLPQNRADR